MTTPVKAAYPSLLKEYRTQFSMEKYGFFRIITTEHNSNRCFSEEHTVFCYFLKVHFAHNTKLNNKHFVIDHNDLTEGIVGKEFVNTLNVFQPFHTESQSCEAINSDIIARVINNLNNHQIHWDCISCQVRAVLNHIDAVVKMPITDVKFGVSSTKLTIKNKKAKYTKRRNIAD